MSAGVTDGISNDDLKALLALHAIWVDDADAPRGRQLSLVDVSVSGLALHGATLAAANVVRCRFSGVTLEECDLSYTTLLGSVFQGCRFIRCSFVKADMKETDFRVAEFSGSDLTRADLTDATLRSADLTGCRLDWVWATRTDLREARLDGTSFDGARLIGTKLHGARGLSAERLRGAQVEGLDLSPGGDGSELVGVDDLGVRGTEPPL
jgi:uncharacterized protein YjbI with pentapeptide repeats